MYFASWPDAVSAMVERGLTHQLVLRLDRYDVIAFLTHVLAELHLFSAELILACRQQAQVNCRLKSQPASLWMITQHQSML